MAEEDIERLGLDEEGKPLRLTPTPVHRDTRENGGYTASTLGAMPDKVSSRHRVLMRHLIAGYSVTDAAKLCGYTTERASLISQSGLFREEMSRMQAELDRQFLGMEAHKISGDFVRQRLREEAASSLERLVQLRDSAENEAVAARSAMDLLDRAGYKPKLEVEGTVTTVQVSDGVAEALRLAIAEMKATVPPLLSALVAPPQAGVAPSESPSGNSLKDGV